MVIMMMPGLLLVNCGRMLNTKKSIISHMHNGELSSKHKRTVFGLFIFSASIQFLSYFYSLRFFNPRDIHGTVLPRESSRDFAISRGIHTTIRSKEVAKALEFETVRSTYDQRSAYWRSLD